MATDFEKSRKEKILNSPNLSNIARGTLILKDCDIAKVILAQATGRRTCYSRSQIFVKKYEIMRTFDVRYENRTFFHRSFVEAIRKCQNKQMKS